MTQLRFDFQYFSYPKPIQQLTHELFYGCETSQGFTTFCFILTHVIESVTKTIIQNMQEYRFYDKLSNCHHESELILHNMKRLTYLRLQKLLRLRCTDVCVRPIVDAFLLGRYRF